MAMIQGIDGSALINAFRQGKADRYNDEQRAMEMQAMQDARAKQAQMNGLMGQLFGPAQPAGVAQQFSAPPQQPAKPTFDSAFSPDAMQSIQNGGNPPVQAPAAPVAPVPAMPGQNYAPSYDPNVLRKLIILNPEVGGKIATALKTMNEDDLKMHQAKNDIMGAAAHFIAQSADPQERLARLQQAAPQLMAAGWTQQEIAGAAQDLSDRKLQAFQAVAIDYDKMIDNELAQREFLAGKTVAVPGGGSVGIIKPVINQDGSISTNSSWAIGGGGSPAPQSGGAGNIPPAAIDYLRQHPETKDAFNQKYGAGAADRIMGGGAGNGAGNFRP